MGEHISVETVTMLTGMVTAITEAVKKYFPGISGDAAASWAPLMAAIITILVLAAWAISNEPGFDRSLVYPYLAVFASIWVGSMGTHSVITHLTSRTINKPKPRRIHKKRADVDTDIHHADVV